MKKAVVQPRQLRRATLRRCERRAPVMARQSGILAGALSGSTVGAGAGEILFGSTAAAAGCTSFSSAVGGFCGSKRIARSGHLIRLDRSGLRLHLTRLNR
jgi:hypothetical protein